MKQLALMGRPEKSIWLAWVDTYRLRLAGGQFDDFLQIMELDLDKQVAAAEKIWTVEFDGFNQFTYQK